MSTADRINRARWSRDQKARAHVQMGRQFEQERADKLAALQAQVAMFSEIADPLAARIVEAAKLEIVRLTAA